jgi:hypothetical protein
MNTKPIQFRITPAAIGYAFQRNDWAGNGGCALWQTLETCDNEASAQLKLDVAEGRLSREQAAKIRVGWRRAKKK